VLFPGPKNMQIMNTLQLCEEDNAEGPGLVLAREVFLGWCISQSTN
jgi:hypothetical protein